MICIKLHKSYRNTLAVCDSELIGKRFEEGKRQLDCRESFFKEKEVSHKEAIELMNQHALEDATFNIIGRESIKAATEAEIIRPEDVQEVQGVPFILILL